MTKLPGFQSAPITRYSLTNQGPVIGVKTKVCYGLAIWPYEVMSRRTLRALLPAGEPKWLGAQGRWNRVQKGSVGKRNPVSENFKKALKELEDDGLIQRGQDFVRIVDHRALLDRALEHVSDPSNAKFLEIDRAISEVIEAISSEARPGVQIVLRRELAALRKLMEAPVGSRDSRRRSVRHESGRIDIPLGETARRWNPTKNRQAK